MSRKSTGWLLLLGSIIVFVASLYSILLSKFLPRPEHRLLAAVADDRYYCLVLPGLIPIGVVFVFFNWLGWKYYIHN